MVEAFFDSYQRLLYFANVLATVEGAFKRVNVIGSI